MLMKLIDNLRIKYKLIASSIIAVCIPILIIGIMLTNGMKNLAIKNATREASDSVDRIQTRIEQIFKVINDVSDQIYTDNALAILMTSDYSSDYEMQMAIRNYNEITKVREVHSEIKWIRIYPYNERLLTNWVFIQPDNHIKRSEWYKSAIEKDGAIIWRYAYDETHNAKYLTLLRVLKDRATQPFGLIAITVDKDYLYSAIQQEPFQTIIMDDKNNIVLSGDRKNEGKKINSIELDAKLLHKTNTISDTLFKHKRSKIIIKEFTPAFSTTKFKIISVFPIESITSEANKTGRLGLTILIVSLLVSIALIIIFSNALSNRIIKLSSYVNRVFKEDFNVDVSSNIRGNDEVGKLSADIDTMVQNIRKLVYEVYEMNIQKQQLSINQKEIQLKMLASQINPHFMFNALETIRMRTLCKGDEETAEIVWQFGKLMRRNLEVSKGEVSLESEIDIVKSYLQIQKYRFGDRVDYDININSDIKEVTILPLLIQPIVENAFVHGLEDKEEDGKIEINVDRVDNTIIITVKDNGLGIEEKKLVDIISHLDSSEDSNARRIGLNNIYQRIQLYYGKDYGFSIGSKTGEGTVVKINIPAKGREKYV